MAPVGQQTASFHRLGRPNLFRQFWSFTSLLSLLFFSKGWLFVPTTLPGKAGQAFHRCERVNACGWKVSHTWKKTNTTTMTETKTDVNTNTGTIVCTGVKEALFVGERWNHRWKKDKKKVQVVRCTPSFQMCVLWKWKALRCSTTRYRPLHTYAQVQMSALTKALFNKQLRQKVQCWTCSRRETSFEVIQSIYVFWILNRIFSSTLYLSYQIINLFP